MRCVAACVGIALLVLVLAGCGDSGNHGPHGPSGAAGGTTSASATALDIIVTWPQGRWDAYHLTCDPASGTVRAPTALCRVIDLNRLMLRPPARTAACATSRGVPVITVRGVANEQAIAVNSLRDCDSPRNRALAAALWLRYLSPGCRANAEWFPGVTRLYSRLPKTARGDVGDLLAQVVRAVQAQGFEAQGAVLANRTGDTWTLMISLTGSNSDGRGTAKEALRNHGLKRIRSVVIPAGCRTAGPGSS